MGSGKTTVGRLLAKKLGMRFVDSDHEIEARTGATVSWIFEIEGEDSFRRREVETIDDLTSQKGVVLATGGGAVVHPENRKNLKARGTVIYLRATVNNILQRTMHDKSRPLLQTENRRQKIEELARQRARYCAALADYAGQAHGECSGEKEELTLTYQTVRTVTDPFGPQMDIYQALRQHMEDHAAAERASRLCLSGPHKDDLEVLINGRSARQFASQGQVRTAALSLKLAEREIHKNAVGEYPVMLLDDVLSELDPRRQEYVLNRIRGGQVFITCCENDRLDTMLRGRVFHIRNGEVL